MADPKNRLDDMIIKLKGRNCRITPQRLAILKILSDSKTHPSTEMIYQKVKMDFPTTSLATVYKTVTLLKEIGEVLELRFNENSNRYDGRNPGSHPHLICTQCKNIVDPEIAALDKLPRQLEQKTGYRIVSHRLNFFGICPACQQKR